MTLQEIDNELARLEALRKEAVKAHSEQRAAARKQLVLEYDYSVTWCHPAQFRIERKLSAAARAALESFIAEWGSAVTEPFVGGMTYSLLEGGYVISGGGAVVVDFQPEAGRRWSSFDPMPIDADDLASLRAGIVPDRIKRP